jgi:hypothetical protein
MDQWIAALAGLLGASVGTLAKETAQRLMSLWKTVTSFFGRVKGGWERVYAQVRRWALAQARHALATANALRWFVTTYVPYEISQLADSIAAWTRERIAAAIAIVASRLDQLAGWVERAVAAVVGELRQWRDYMAGRLASFAAWADRVGRLVFGLLDSPDRLVAWILAPLVAALWSLAVDNLARIGVLAWRARERLVLAALGVAEDILARII